MPIDSALELPCGAVLPNRLCKAAMTEGLADKFDRPTVELNRLYERWSEGGAGLLITGNVMVDKRYLERGGNVVTENESGLAELSEWAKAGTKAGNHLWMQINHPGRQCARLVNSQPVSPSDVQLDILANFGKPRALHEDEIEDIICRFAETARIARKAGFTGVQIHSAHGYLGSQFLSPMTNHRNDKWGGCLENRARFLLETIRRVRQTVGANFPISVKLNSSDFQKGGFSQEDCIQVVKMIGEEGIDLLEISGGTYEQLAFMNPESSLEVRDSSKKREAYFLQYARAIQRSLNASGNKTPLMVTGGFRSADGMQRALESQETDMIGLGRPLCTDPDFPNRIINGSVNSAPDYQANLVLGSGYWGNNSPSSSVRGINNQGQAGWYYYQIVCLANDKPLRLRMGVLSSFIRHMGSDLVKVVRRKFV